MLIFFSVSVPVYFHAVKGIRLEPSYLDTIFKWPNVNLFLSVFAYWLWWSISIRFMWVMPKKGPKSQRIIYRPCSKSGPICALTLSYTAHYLGRYAQKHELKRAARITIEQSCGTHGLGLCRRYWPFCGWAHLVKVVYISSKILKLTVGLRDLSQAEKKLLLFKLIHKMTTIFTRDL